MLILPAIDIRHAACVRLYQGRPDQETVYSTDPVEMAHIWKARGATMLHVVDLDGAFEGKPVNLPLIKVIRQEVHVAIEVGGGFRDMLSISQGIEAGADRVILGTVAIRNPALVQEAVRSFGDRVSVSIDVNGSFAAAAGWKEISAITFADLAKRMRDIGVRELLFTDTRRDGTLLGPDLAMIEQFLGAANMSVTISGGVTTIEDVTNLKMLEPKGVKAAVIGKALYDKRIQLEDALRVA
jgi:phosphoribosylformimino-5-aminoimidazole carboxamide ribotide isomerase